MPLITTAATYLGYFSSAFILLPAGRDIVANNTCLLPGEEKTRPLMQAQNKKAQNFMWGVWGVNHCGMSILKCIAIMNDDKFMLQFQTVQSALCFIYLVKENEAITSQGGDTFGFIVICGLQMATLGWLGWM